MASRVAAVLWFWVAEGREGKGMGREGKGRERGGKEGGKEGGRERESVTAGGGGGRPRQPQTTPGRNDRPKPSRKPQTHPTDAATLPIILTWTSLCRAMPERQYLAILSRGVRESSMVRSSNLSDAGGAGCCGCGCGCGCGCRCCFRLGSGTPMASGRSWGGAAVAAAAAAAGSAIGGRFGSPRGGGEGGRGGVVFGRSGWDACMYVMLCMYSS